MTRTVLVVIDFWVREVTYCLESGCLVKFGLSKLSKLT